MSDAATYHVWVFGQNSHKWERYTAVPFYSKATAEEWIREYIPEAKAEVRIVTPPTKGTPEHE